MKLGYFEAHPLGSAPDLLNKIHNITKLLLSPLNLVSRHFIAFHPLFPRDQGLQQHDPVPNVLIFLERLALFHDFLALT